MENEDRGFKNILENLKLRARFAARDAIPRIKYELSVKSNENSGAERDIFTFNTEMFNFILNNRGLLQKLQLSPEQDDTLNNLFFNIKEKKLIVEKSLKGILPSGDRDPYIARAYSAQNPENPTQVDGYASLWNVRHKYPIITRIAGYRKKEHIGTLSFIALEKKAENASDLEGQIGKSVSGQTTYIYIFNDGKRIIVDREWDTCNTHTESTSQFHLLGTNYGEISKRNYFIYGSNSVQLKKTTSESIKKEWQPCRNEDYNSNRYSNSSQNPFTAKSI